MVATQWWGGVIVKVIMEGEHIPSAEGIQTAESDETSSIELASDDTTSEVSVVETHESEQLLSQLEAANIAAGVEGKLRLGEAWGKIEQWGSVGWEKAVEVFEWAKKTPETYPEAIGKAALYSLGTTVLLAPVFLARNCMKVHGNLLKQKSSQFKPAS